MCRLLCSLLVSLAVTDGAIPYPSSICQNYSQPLENHLINQQLEQCIDSQSYRPITYCLHNQAMYIQGTGCQKCFPVMSLTAVTFSLPEDPNPVQYPNTMALPSCPCASIYPQMPRRCYNPEELSVCKINGKTYWTGTIMQTNEIMDQLCPKKSGLAYWQYDPGYRVNFPLDPRLYQIPNANYCLLFIFHLFLFSSVQLLSHVPLFANP